ncbi:MAG: hypothetical protein HOU81_08975 [Hamadaea sp.]|nr:hypothetical protein [Hamadaea sp.]NUT21727.1 hypothetical protein [Hamadaea sp.]
MTTAKKPPSTFAAIAVLIGLEILVIALLTAIGVTGTPAVVAVVAFAFVERVAYVRWFKRRA